MKRSRLRVGERKTPPYELVRAVLELERVGLVETRRAVDAERRHMSAQSVRCLQCGYEYMLIRRHRRGIQANVCPSCSYAGWAPTGPATSARGRAQLG